MEKTFDINIKNYKKLEPPKEFLDELPISAKISEKVTESRQIINNIISGKDTRLLIITGPCSIHDEKAGIEYANKLVKLQSKINKNIYLVMRAYFEKPRTTVGWKGLINDPDLNGTFDMSKGLRKARKFLLDILDLGLPAGTEFLDPFTPQYLADLISWGAIGARTTESQTHREMASGLSMPIGFKNGTGGSIQIAVDAMYASQSSHSFLGIDSNGKACILNTKGNKYTHIILRGSTKNTNFDAKSIKEAMTLINNINLTPSILVDCSHANCNKNHEKQKIAFEDVLKQRVIDKNTGIVGIMLESHINEGNQSLPSNLSDLQYGVSITDPCINWKETEELLVEANSKIENQKNSIN
jgi:3-deoxy-7-phosphoheptulonate synthase